MNFSVYVAKPGGMISITFILIDLERKTKEMIPSRTKPKLLPMNANLKHNLFRINKR